MKRTLSVLMVSLLAVTGLAVTSPTATASTKGYNVKVTASVADGVMTMAGSFDSPNSGQTDPEARCDFSFFTDGYWSLLTSREVTGDTDLGTFTRPATNDDTVYYAELYCEVYAGGSIDKVVYVRVGDPKVTGTAPTIPDTTPVVGSVLQARSGVWTPGSPTLTFQWYRGSAKIKKATGLSYTVTAKDLGHKLRLKVTGSRPGYKSATTWSTATAKVTKGTFVTGTPKITGQLQKGKTLKAVAGTWTPKASKYKYQWFRGTKKIKNATKASYKLKSADVGKQVTVRVTGTKAGYKAATVRSAATAAISK